MRRARGPGGKKRLTDRIAAAEKSPGVLALCFAAWTRGGKDDDKVDAHAAMAVVAELVIRELARLKKGV